MDPRAQTELDVGGDGYNDLLLCTECVMVNVRVELQLRYNELRLWYKAHLLVKSGVSVQVKCPLSRYV